MNNIDKIKHENAVSVSRELIAYFEDNKTINHYPNLVLFFSDIQHIQQIKKLAENPDEIKYRYNYIRHRDKNRDITNLIQDIETIKRKRYNVTNRVVKFGTSIAAAILLGVVIFDIVGIVKEETDRYQNTTIHASITKPTIILDNGDEITLDNGESLSQIAGIISVSKNKITYNSETNIKSHTQYNTLIVPKGYMQTVELSDGSKITINSGGELRYPTLFDGKERIVEIKGQAYFDVAKSNQPFVVRAEGASIKVYGTKFTVSNWSELSFIETVLLEGQIGFKSSENTPEMILKPNKRVVFNTVDNSITSDDVNASDYITWMDNHFKYVDVSLRRILHDLSQCYDVNFVANEQMLNTILTMEFNKEKDVAWILSSLEIILNSKITKKGGNEYVIE